MVDRLGVGWRVSLFRECVFYFLACKNWRQVMSARLRSAVLRQFELRTGQVIAFGDNPPWQIFNEVWREQVYTRESIRKMSEPQTILDIGGNIGVFSLYASHRWPSATIHAYEPAPDNLKWFEGNIQLSHSTNICLHPLAVAGSSGKRTLYLGDGPGWHSLWGKSSHNTLLVETTTLDAILEQLGASTIDLLKIDCEGAEYEILDNREQLLTRYIRFLAIEYHCVADRDVRNLVRILECAGFEYRAHPEPSWGTGMLYARNLALQKNEEHKDWRNSEKARGLW